MRIRFQADADLDPAIGRGVLRRQPAIDWRHAQRVIPDATPDPRVLELAAQSGRVLVTRDVTTMPGHFASYAAGAPSPGVVLVSPALTTGQAIDRLVQMWDVRDAQEIVNQMWWL